MTNQEIIELFIQAFKDIKTEAERLTTGNLAHHKASIKGMCESILTLYEKIKNGEI